MTISRYINEFISNYLGATIETNHLSAEADKYGLFKSPSREIIRSIDGSDSITEHYQFYIRQDGISEINRTDSDEFLESLTYWIDDYSFYHEYPPLDGGRIVTNITATGCPYSYEADSNKVIYQIALSITYTREREV